ncbi:nuclear transport factor 2 family protein [Paeniglutamicibacter terrestris]|uniref:Nuclear transport factor 2 family protein n=1 Tax=Paeniglutamicibacter terrestris TaxID=2723403 RepID=A0ABX1G189_9MICC|nr:nuclear transport factor 2 family protein [Paeniglutamicibacter terrestris]NKG19763.1 nuclear transport factor 2 family protein [Paeniglutamicibacter terrestris]
MTQPNTDAAEAAIRAVNAEENRLMVAGDTDGLNDLLADGFVLVHITGYEQSKAEWLEHIGSGQMSYHLITEEEVSVSVNGTRAELVARNLVDATIWGSQAIWPLKMRTTFALRGGNWEPAFSRATTY